MSYIYIIKFSARSPLGQVQESPQQTALIPILQECIDTITVHQRLRSLMKGELVKGLLPQSSVRADYTVQRIRGNFFFFPGFIYLFIFILFRTPMVVENCVICQKTYKRKYTHFTLICPV